MKKWLLCFLVVFTLSGCDSSFDEKKLNCGGYVAVVKKDNKKLYATFDKDKKTTFFQKYKSKKAVLYEESDPDGNKFFYITEDRWVLFAVEDENTTAFECFDSNEFQDTDYNDVIEEDHYNNMNDLDLPKDFNG